MSGIEGHHRDPHRGRRRPRPQPRHPRGHHPRSPGGLPRPGHPPRLARARGLRAGPGADNSSCIAELSEELVNRAGRTGGTFLHTSRTRPSHLPLELVPEHLRDRYGDAVNDITPDILKNLDFLGIDYLVPIGGDDTLSYAHRLHEEGVKRRRHPEDHGQRRSGYRLLHRLQHVRDADDRAHASAAHVGGLARAHPGHRGIRPLRRVHGAPAHHGGRRRPVRDPRTPFDPSASPSCW